jgi:glucose/arabinose dehydrogenase
MPLGREAGHLVRATGARVASLSPADPPPGYAPEDETMRFVSIAALMRLLVVATLLPLAGMATGSAGAATIRLAPVASGFELPLFVTGAGTGSSRLFVVEKPGRIRIVANGKILSPPFLDITNIVNDEAGERGLLGLAFHPDYERNGFFYVDYTDANGDIVIARYSVSRGNPDRANVSSARILLKIRHRNATNHNGGMLAFGPRDGYLYISVGDGGAKQAANAQKTDTLLGKILRIDVDRTSGGRLYGIPPDNPFAGSATKRPEIWAYGLRNPFRFSFDRKTAAMFIGDVGQREWEEVDYAPHGKGGLNYGWSIMEGRHCFDPPTGCPTDGLRMPIFEYSHDDGNVVTGGYVYRGQAIPALVGTYVFTDFGSRQIWGLTRNQNGRWVFSVLLRFENERNIASFGENDKGELFAVDLVAGILYRVAPA